MVSSDLWTGIDSRLEEIFVMIPVKASAGLSAMTVADLLQLPDVFLIFSKFDRISMKHLSGTKLWHLFKYAELTELFIDMINKVDKTDDDDDDDDDAVENFDQGKIYIRI